MQKNFDEIVHLQSERRVNTNGERLHGTVEGWSSATRLANPFPRRNLRPIVARYETKSTNQCQLNVVL